ncbi:MAG: hypothetical protein V3V14_12270 [Saprospiraceae bacterium]
MRDLKNTLTNILGFIIIIITTINAYLENLSGDIDWMKLAVGIILAVGSYIQGKDKNIKAKIR